MKYNIAVVPGDGIGPEVIEETLRVLGAATKGTDIQLLYTTYLAGGCAIDEAGKPLPDETVEGTKKSDAVLLGAVGGEKWDGPRFGYAPGKRTARAACRSWVIC